MKLTILFATIALGCSSTVTTDPRASAGSSTGGTGGSHPGGGGTGAGGGGGAGGCKSVDLPTGTGPNMFPPLCCQPDEFYCVGLCCDMQLHMCEANWELGVCCSLESVCNPDAGS